MEAHSTRPKVLYVDDEEMYAELAKIFLDQRGDCDVYVEHSPSRALDRIRTDRFDVIVSEYEMPGMNGLELLMKIKELGMNTPFIIFTRQDREEVVTDAINQGAEFYLHKTGPAVAQFAELSNMILRSLMLTQAEKRLTISEERYRQLVECANSIIMERDLDGNILFMNRYGLEFFGYSEGELIGRNVVGTIVPEIDSEGRNLREMIMSVSDDPHSFCVNENQNMFRDGTLVWVSWTNKGLFDENGNKVGILAVGHEITERKEAEAALKRSEGMIREILDALSDAFLAFDGDLRIRYFNRAAEDLLCVKREEVLGSQYIESFPWMENILGRDLAVRILEGNESLITEISIDLADKKKWLEMRAQPSRELVLVYFWSIEERIERDNELRRSQEKYQTIIDQSADGILLVDIEGRAVETNKAFRDLTGYYEGDLSDFNLMQLCVSEDETWVREVFQLTSNGGSGISRDVHIMSREGEAIPVDINFISIQPGSEMLLAVIFRDNRERNKMMSALETANRKLNLLGSITRHDLMNQLTTLFGHLEIAKIDVDNPDLEERLEKAIVVGENIKHFLDFGGDYEQMGTHEPDWVPVGEAFEKGLSTVEIQEVNVHCKLEGLEVFADPMLEKVFHNLLDNSCRHSDNLSEINVYYELMDHGMKLVYEDDGIGILDEFKPRLFDGSMGHGLFLVREILGITEIGIEETGVPGEGARFEILVPNGKYRLMV